MSPDYGGGFGNVTSCCCILEGASHSVQSVACPSRLCRIIRVWYSIVQEDKKCAPVSVYVDANVTCTSK